MFCATILHCLSCAYTEVDDLDLIVIKSVALSAQHIAITIIMLNTVQIKIMKSSKPIANKRLSHTNIISS